jgi:hypothetical protein
MQKYDTKELKIDIYVRTEAALVESADTINTGYDHAWHITRSSPIASL